MMILQFGSPSELIKLENMLSCVKYAAVGDPDFDVVGSLLCSRRKKLKKNEKNARAIKIFLEIL